MDYKDKSFYELNRLFERGQLDPYEAMKDYQRMRDSAMRQVRRIQQSDVKMTIERPEFVKPSEIKSTSELLHAISDVQQYQSSGNYSIRERRRRRDEAIKTMRARGMNFVDESNYNAWAKFMNWFRSNKVNKIYGSREDIVENFFEENWSVLEGTPVEKWKQLFEEFTGVKIPG